MLSLSATVLALAILHPAPQDEETEPEWPKWKGAVLLGVTDTSGNTENFNATSAAEATRETEHNLWEFKFYQSYAEQEEVLTERKAGASAKYEYLAGERYYYFAKAAADSDLGAMLDLRTTVGVGVGYQLIENDKTSWAAELGIAHVSEEFDDGSDEDNVSLSVGYDLEHDFSEKTKFTQSLDAYPVLDDFDDVYARIETKLTTSLTEKMFAGIRYVVDFDHTPADIDGVKQTDHSIALTLGWTFGE